MDLTYTGELPLTTATLRQFLSRALPRCDAGAGPSRLRIIVSVPELHQRTDQPTLADVLMHSIAPELAPFDMSFSIARVDERNTVSFDVVADLPPRGGGVYGGRRRRVTANLHAGLATMDCQEIAVAGPAVRLASLDLDNSGGVYGRIAVAEREEAAFVADGDDVQFRVPELGEEFDPSPRWEDAYGLDAQTAAVFDEAMRGVAGNAFTVVESLFVRALNDAHDQIVAAVNSTIVLPAA